MIGLDPKTVSEIHEKADKAASAWGDSYDAMKEDTGFALGDQWLQSDIEINNKVGAPSLVINRIKKIVDTIVGLQIQNRVNMGVVPIEGSDELLAEVLNRLVVWTTKTGGFESKWTEGSKSAITGGLGWVFLHVSYDSDPINGEIQLIKCSRSDILPDPDFTDIGLSDCSYIIHRKKIDKDKIKEMYPALKDEIEAATSCVRNSVFERWADSTDFQPGKQLEVIEYWYRSYDRKKFIVDKDENLTEWTGDDETLEVKKEQEGVRVVEKRMPVIKLTIVAGDSVVLYDGGNPYEIDDFPHQPIFGFYDADTDDLKYRIQGIVRNLKDPQRELNKRRVQTMKAILKMPLSGLLVEENSIQDESVLAKGGGKGGLLVKFRKGSTPPVPMRPPEIPNAVVLLDNQSQAEFSQITIPPDLLGMVSDAGASGLTVQLRQKQGIAGIQELFSNQSNAYRMLGVKLVKLILRNYGKKKILRILGNDYPIYEQIKALQMQDNQLKQAIMQRMDESEAQKGKLDDEERFAADYEFRQNAEIQAKNIQQQIAVLQQEDEMFWARFEESKTQFKYDIVIDETANSPTARAASLAQLQAGAQLGIQVPPEFFLEMSDIPKSVKDKLSAILEQQRQQQMQMLQMQLQEKAEDRKIEQMKAVAGMSGKVQQGGMQ